MLDPARCLKACAATTTASRANELRLAFINVLRALRTLHRLTPDNNVKDLVAELEPYLSQTAYTSLQYLQDTFWQNPNVPHLEKLIEMSYGIFFAVYACDKEYDLFDDMSSYVEFRLYNHPETIYPLFVKAGLAGSLEQAEARYGPEPQEALENVAGTPAIQAAIRAMRLADWKTYHEEHFWKYDEVQNLERVFPSTYKHLNCIP